MRTSKQNLQKFQSKVDKAKQFGDFNQILDFKVNSKLTKGRKTIRFWGN